MIRLIWTAMLVAVGRSSYDEYWYTTDEGILDTDTRLDEHVGDNLTNILRFYATDTSKQDLWDKQSRESVKELKRAISYQAKSNIDTFKRIVFPLPEGAKYCTVGAKRRVDCNLCRCIAGQMYLCTSKICATRVQTLLGRSCRDGTKRKLDDGCNYCICTDGQEFCTAKSCSSDSLNMKLGYGLPACTNGKVISGYQGCNTCYCIENVFHCTNMYCGAVGDTKKLNRLPHLRCKEGNKRHLPDGCNYCICQNGEDFCSMIPCPSNIYAKHIYYLKAQCIDGEEPPAKDDCNTCVCMDGQMLCSTRECVDGVTHKHSRGKKRGLRRDMTQRDCLRCLLEKGIYNCEAFCIGTLSVKRGPCSNGQTYKSDCIVCECIRGVLKCLYICDNDHQKTSYKVRESECGKDFTALPSQDCNKCMCLGGEKICTNMQCRGDKPEDPKSSLIDKFCSKGKFYSPNRNRFCKNCFCLGRGVSICFLNMCKFSKDTPNFELPAPGKECVPGEVEAPTECVNCTCNSTGFWECQRSPNCKGKECNPGDEFQLGTRRKCHGCKCDDNGIWFCGVSKKPCLTYDFGQCTPAGTFIRNEKLPCSACVCGRKGNVCFTDMRCSRQVVADMKDL